MASKNLTKVRRTQKLAQYKLLTLLHMQGRTIQDLDNIAEGTEAYYDSERNTIIQSVRNVALEITSWEVEAALRDMKNGSTTGNDHMNIETLKAGVDTISMTLAVLYSKCLSERRIPTSLEEP